MADAGFESVIGLEVHARLRTRSKIFCGCEAVYGAPPNTRVCPVCLGLPGALPVLNARAVELTLRLGLALGCVIRRRSVMARKHYVYPDLPKGYQISQFALPLCEGGSLALTSGLAPRPIGLTRIHIEEDAGKSLHGDGETLIDLNRCGVPLAEVVTEPDLRDPAEARAWLKRLHALLVRLDVCDGRLEEGAFRCDVNVSLRPRGARPLGVKTEIKNINSFRNVERALTGEIARQRGILEAGGAVTPRTLLWDAVSGGVTPMRDKEASHDYRYIPEPDLPLVVVEEALLERLRAELPELPDAARERMAAAYGLGADDARRIADDPDLAAYFEALCAAGCEAAAAVRWLTGEVARRLRGRAVSSFGLAPAGLAELLRLESDGKVGAAGAVRILDWMLETGGTAAAGLEELGLEAIVDAAELAELAARVLAEHAAEADRFRRGERQLLGYLMGRGMAASGGRADPAALERALRVLLD